MIRRILVLIGVLSATSLIHARSLSDLSVGAPLPEFSLEDSRGRAFSSSALRGNPALVAYLKAGQTASESFLSDCMRWGKEFPKLQLVFVSGEDTLKATNESAAARFLLDRDKNLYGAWGVRVFPSMVLVDENGRVLKVDAGYSIGGPEKWHNDLAKLLDPENARTPSGEMTGPAAGASDEAVRFFQVGKRMWDEGLFERAYESWGQSLQADSGYVPARLGIAKYLMRTGEIEQAEIHLAAVQNVETSAEALILRARCRMRRDDLDGAQALLESALDANRRSVEAKLALAEVHLLEGGISEAAALVDEVMALDKNNPRGLYLRGRIAEAQNDLGAAIENYRRALDILANQQ